MNRDISDRFEYKAKLGQGAFGSAFLVERKSTKRLYVIKEQYGIATGADMWNEAEILRRMRHPNIVSYYSAWQNERKTSILMEYCSAGTLDDYLHHRNRPMSEENALYLFCQILLGIHHIHRKFILHRDLKPANIMLHDNDRFIVKIGDFGIAKNISQEIAQTVIGTKLYMAPEVLRGSIYEFKCDIWSAGIILFEMITNGFPFDYRDHMKLMQQISRGIDGRIPNNISRTAYNLLYFMVHKDAPKRPSASELILRPAIVRAIHQVLARMSSAEKAMILNHEGLTN